MFSINQNISGLTYVNPNIAADHVVVFVDFFI